MPGKHSPEKLAQRRLRAAQRGYITAKPKDTKFILVKDRIADRARCEVRSLQLHDELNCAAGTPRHFAAHAALAARSSIGEDAFRNAKKVIKIGNAARHRWADAADTDAVDAADPLALCDPWAAFCSVPTSPVCGASSSPLSSPLPSGVCVATQTDSYFRESDDRSEFQFNNLATEFVPAPQPFAATLPLGFDPQPLFDAQNSTIALLAGRLDALAQGAPSHKRLRELERQVKHLAGAVETLQIRPEDAGAPRRFCF